ncbi:hypothetical protein [Mangrovicoccus algicola]|uniref:Uncharacterized protein n=1 Tax=Mangrovicoccus algicola TaxID=2771008 RepID=A0A8J6Z7H7_9RHOB|nr:hypothetical protein [Mangrovicoccus algicola]MBE3639414.1 hypothetical protein [Mangrovicoccus algicola]
MSRLSLAAALPLLLVLAACGESATTRAATGGTAGAVVAGPVGAVVGGTAGAATAEDED